MGNSLPKLGHSSGPKFEKICNLLATLAKHWATSLKKFCHTDAKLFGSFELNRFGRCGEAKSNYFPLLAAMKII